MAHGVTANAIVVAVVITRTERVEVLMDGDAFAEPGVRHTATRQFERPLDHRDRLLDLSRVTARAKRDRFS